MKLWAPFLASLLSPGDGSSAPQERLDPFFNPIIAAHSIVRNAPLSREYEKGLRATERFADAVLNGDERRLETVDELVSNIRNLTSFSHENAERGSCNTRYPTIDGSCNHPSDGGTPMQPYARMQPSDYCDGQSSIKCSSDKKTLPNPRDVSLFLKQRHPTHKRVNDKRTHLMTSYGQFVTHTAIQTPDVGGNGVRCSCSSSQKNCVLVQVKNNDPVFDDISCFFITRSSGTLINQNGKSTREQLNQLTGTITAGSVYGFNKRHLEAIRKPNSAMLRISEMGSRGDFLPITTQIPSKFNDITSSFAVPDVFNDFKHPSFFAGDARVMENTVLTTWHTMFVRLHNVFVEELENVLPKPIDHEFVFNEARLFVIAAMQQVAYREEIPALLGERAISITPGLQPAVNMIPLNPNRPSPAVFNEFTTAAFRYGHSAQPEFLHTKNSKFQTQNSGRLADNYFDPHMLVVDGPGAICRGAMTQMGIKPGPGFVDDTLHNFFQPNNWHHGVDLFSINISRGRDHGLVSYNKMKKDCQADPVFSKYYNGWDGMHSGWDEMVRSLYNNRMWDVDLYIGLLMEKEMDDAELGPTTSCIIARQFIHWKKSDKWHYENDNFFMSQAKFNTLKDLNLAKIICLTMDKMETVPDMPFIADNVMFGGKKRSFVKCSNLIKKLDLSAWSPNAPATDRPTTTIEQETTQEATTEESTTQTDPPTDPPTQPPTTRPTQPPPQTDEPICDFNPDTRELDCSNRHFDDDSIEKMLTRLRITHAYPVDVLEAGTTGSVIRKQVKKEAVWKLNFDNNSQMKDTKMFLEALAEFTFGKSLQARNTGMSDLTKNAVHAAMARIKTTMI